MNVGKNKRRQQGRAPECAETQDQDLWNHAPRPLLPAGASRDGDTFGRLCCDCEFGLLGAVIVCARPERSDLDGLGLDAELDDSLFLLWLKACVDTQGLSLMNDTATTMMLPKLGHGSGSSLPLPVLLVAGICTAIATFVSAMSIVMHLKNYRKPHLQRYVS